MIREGYCRYCSTQKEDVRDLDIRGSLIECTDCGNLLVMIPIKEGPYCYLKQCKPGDIIG